MKYYLVSRVVVDWRGRSVVMCSAVNCSPVDLFIREGAAIVFVQRISKEEYVRVRAAERLRGVDRGFGYWGCVVGGVLGIVVLWFLWG
jgi:hypothetical protein